MKLGTAVILDENLEIRVVVTDIPEDGGLYGDIYDSIEELKENHPKNDWMFGFVIVNSKTGLIPDEEYAFEEFYESIEEAMCDYAKLVVKADFEQQPFAYMIN